MDVKECDIGIWHDSVEIAARRQCALERWYVHAEALHRVGLLHEEELLEILLYADAAYGLVTEELT